MHLKYRQRLFQCPSWQMQADLRALWSLCGPALSSVLVKASFDELLGPFMTAWMGLESIMVSKISQLEKDKYHMISLICGI